MIGRRVDREILLFTEQLICLEEGEILINCPEYDVKLLLSIVYSRLNFISQFYYAFFTLFGHFSFCFVILF